MRREIFKLVKYSCMFFLSVHTTLYGQRNDIEIRFKEPAADFTESLPLGNGRLGAMMFGGVKEEHIALNEISLWSGGPQDADRENAYKYLKPIQDYLLNGDNKNAQDLLMQHFIAKGAGSGGGNGGNDKFGCYQTAGDLIIKWQNPNDKITDYRRVLNIENATALTTYTRNQNLITETAFTDFVNDVIWVKFSSKEKSGLNFAISLDRKENVLKNAAGNKQILLYGQLPSGKDKGMQYAVGLQVLQNNGQISTDNNSLNITNASDVVLAIAMRTNYNYANGGLLSTNVKAEVLNDLQKIITKNYAFALKASTQKFQSYFNRCRFAMPGDTDATISQMTTQERLVNVARGNTDVQLPVLYFNYGRYLLIGSSRPGLLPANLQGLWAVEYQTPWNGDYHTNINVQMNYWPAESTNLSDLTQPLYQFTKNLMTNGAKTAWDYYRAKGWAEHVITNPWFFTSPGEGAGWGSTITGGAWLTTHIWEHYLYTKDKNFLKEYYPVIKGAATFLKSVLIREKKHGWLVTAPSNSPENAYIMPNGFVGNTCMGPTIDMQICRNIFEANIDAAKILGIDAAFADELKAARAQLAPDQISPTNGGIQEWLEDWPPEDVHHRHVSHLYGLYPYDEISHETPDLMRAAIKTLEMRGDDGTGWSKAWKVNFWARTGDGDHALKILKGLLLPIKNDGTTNYSNGGGTYSNLFDGHPPFQIDGNFGGTSGIAEMLLQSQGKEKIIRFLPALPTDAAWANGSIKGMVARGNFTVNMKWADGKLTEAVITSNNGGSCKILLPEGKNIYDIKGNRLKYWVDSKTGVALLNTTAGKQVVVK